ncbi:MAG: hypothetical protein R3C12_15800 [Planctomycetaceae bacterium]|nr:hypothetical protein [Planctomycetaceae bacterium]
MQNLFCRQRLIQLLLLLAVFQSVVTPSRADDPAPAAPVKFGPWKYLLGGPVKSLQKSPIKLLDQFEITGAFPKDSYLLNEVVCDGEWGMVKGALQQTSGRSAALHLGTAQDFELELGINAEGHGGWFMLFGFQNGHGYGIYNVNLKTSGSPWHISEFRGNAGIETTDREFARYICRGNESLTVRVVDSHFTLQIARRVLIENEELPAYSEGDIILGVYDTNYGPKPVKIYGARLRTPLNAP